MNIHGGRVECPMEFLPYALEDPENFAVEFLSWPSGAVNPFFRQWDKVAAVITDWPNPLEEETYALDPTWRADNDEACFMHLDLSINQDAVGISLCQSVESVRIRRASKGRVGVEEVELPLIRFLMVGRLKPRPDMGEKAMDYNALIDLILEIESRGFNLKDGLITFDRFQSHAFMMALRDEDFVCDLLSIDHTTYRVLIDWDKDERVRRESVSRSPAMAMMDFREAIYQGRVAAPQVPAYNETMNWFQKECNEALWDAEKGKVVKAEGYGTSDDLLQSMAGAAFNCQNNTHERNDPLPDRTQHTEERDFYRTIGRAHPDLIDKSLGRDPALRRAQDQLVINDEYIEDDFPLYRQGGWW